jgi:sterol desaturase/sphingolipid hydroxylase (fatty acid hydroxylase superfamily)
VRKDLYTETFVQTVDRWDGTLLAPSSENRKLEGVRVFRSDWFETVFAKMHPIMPGVWWGPIGVACVYLSVIDERFGWFRGLLGVLFGFLTWTLLEYVLHRFVFHLVPDGTFEGKLRQFMVHGYHHEFPNDRMRLVAPLLLSAPIGALIAAIYVLLLGRYDWMMWYAGTVIGYLAYDWTHYYTHHFRPTTRLGKFLRRYHMEHHYKDSDSHFGISSPLWDWVFGTAHTRTGDASNDTAPALRGAASSGEREAMREPEPN